VTDCFVETRFLPVTGNWAKKFVFIAFPLLVFATDALRAEDPGPQQIKELDGKSFSGELGLIGKPASANDLLVFDNGMFVSKGCEARCGYTAAEYQVSTSGDRYQVKSETPCLNSDAIIQWQGTVDGDSIEGTFTWINKRWYWSFEKVFWFKGKLVDSTTE
jgi:hypothetical protein